MPGETKLSYDELIASWGIDKQSILYLCNVSHRFKICYIETPRVACSTIKKTLQTAEIYPRPWDFHTPHMKRGESPLRFIDENTFASILYSEEYFKFSFVREPFARVLSAYMEKMRQLQLFRPDPDFHKRYAALGLDVRHNVSFLDFLRRIAELPPQDLDIHWCPQHLLLNFDKIKYDHIGRFERFAEDFSVVQNVIYERSGIKFDTQSVEWRKVDAQSKIKYFLTKETADLVSRIYASDYECFRYPFPRPGASYISRVFPSALKWLRWFLSK